MKANMTIAENFKSDRLHHQLIPNVVDYEGGFDQEIVEGLRAKNHTMKLVTVTFGFGALVGVANDNGNLSAAYDPRRGGSINVF
jgi:gamma-glutamyltranspeptidase